MRNPRVRCAECNERIDMFEAKTITDSPRFNDEGMKGIPVWNVKRYCDRCYNKLIGKESENQ
ncbi:MAG: hypothetical protein AABW67_02610 [Nanoarchaeota archaeon]